MFAIVAIGGIVGSRGHLHTLCLPQARRLRTQYLLAGGDACAPGQALLILCSWVAHSLLLLYFFFSSQLLHYFITTPSLLFHYFFTTSSLLLYFFYLLLLCSLVRLPINRDNTSDCTSLLCYFIHTKSADLELLIHKSRPSHCL